MRLWRAQAICARALKGAAAPTQGGDLIPWSGTFHAVSNRLLRLHAATGESRFREAALEGLAYERSLYSPADRNWPDLRESSLDLPGSDPGSPYFMSAWCHGAAGIGRQ